MAAVISATNPNLLLLDELADFQAHALQAVCQARRQVCILSTTLDAPLYDSDEFYDAVRTLVTRDRYAQARFLVKDIKPMVEHGHRLLQLARRLSGKADIRKLTVDPQNADHAWMIVDEAVLLYKHDDVAYKGYVDYDTTAKCRLLLEEFSNLWDLYGEEDPNLREQLL